MPNIKAQVAMPYDLKKCVEFHGHLCPGLVYGYRVAKEAIRLMDLGHSIDEEIVAVCENDSCAIDALQILLGTTAGKGNLIIQNVGKNAYTLLNRSTGKAYRFARKIAYQYKGDLKKEFDCLETSIKNGTASEEARQYFKRLKAMDLLICPFEELFTMTEEVSEAPSYATISSSIACTICGEMTMASKMVTSKNGQQICIPCSEK